MPALRASAAAPVPAALISVPQPMRVPSASTTPCTREPLCSSCATRACRYIAPSEIALRPQRHHQRVGVEPAFAAQAQRRAGQVVHLQPAEACAQRLGFEQLHLGPQLALRAVVGVQRVQPGGAGQEQVAAFAPGQVGRIAVHRQLRRRLADEVAAEHRHADVLRRRELVPHRGHRQRGGAALVAEILFQHQQPAVEGRRAGQEVGGGAAHGRAADDHDLVVLHALQSLPNIMAR